MAELVGLVASVVGLAGAAATASLTLFECARRLTNAKKDFESLALDVSDLSNVLEYLVEVIKKHESHVVQTTIKTLDNLVKRCERVLEELRVTAELVKAKSARFKWLFRKPKTMEHKLNLEGFKSNLSLVIQTLILARTIEQESQQCVSISMPISMPISFISLL